MLEDQKGFTTFEHLADIGIRGFGPRREDAFAQAAKALFSLMVDDLQSVEKKDKIVIEASGFDLESLFVNWLNRLISCSDIHQMILSLFNLDIQGLDCWTEAWGEKFSYSKHGRGIEVKGATMSEVAVYNAKGIWNAQCIVDV